MRVSFASLTVTAPTQGFLSEASATSTSSGIFYAVVTGVPRPFREPGIQVPRSAAGRRAVVHPALRRQPRAHPRRQRRAARRGGDRRALGRGDHRPRRRRRLCVPHLHDPAGCRDARRWPARPTWCGRSVPATATEATVASFNLERFFDTVNDPGVSDVVLTAGRVRDAAGQGLAGDPRVAAPARRPRRRRDGEPGDAADAGGAHRHGRGRGRPARPGLRGVPRRGQRHRRHRRRAARQDRAGGRRRAAGGGRQRRAGRADDDVYESRIPAGRRS